MARTEPTTGSRLERRKAQTRRKLVDAARAMLADGSAQHASIQEITDAADVGFGSFYNHFASKDELFDAAVLDVMDEISDALDHDGDEVADPAERFARSVRLTARFATDRPEVARVLVRHGLPYLDAGRGPAPRALRDIESAVIAGRFTVANARLALATTMGSLLATLHLSLTQPDLRDDGTWQQLTEQLLRMFGMPAATARKLATTPL